MTPRELIVDSFAGGGGASLGISWALGRGPDIAINHDREAIALHAANHGEARHYAEDVWQVDPLEATGGHPVGLMWLSPDCKHFSKAKGGKPVSKRVRGLAWVAVRWAKAVRPRVIVLENVEEFQTWGPVLDDGRPCPRRKGLTFRRFVGRLRNLGYAVEWRELRACDFGAPTIRKRLFLIARCDGLPIAWPKPTHGRYTGVPYRTAAECIDWSIPCPSIFERARPLAENTLRRIGAGMRRFVFEAPRPFIVQVQNASSGNAPVDLDKPLRTVTAHPKGGGFALVAPTLTALRGTDPAHLRGEDVTEPLRTISAGGTHHALVAGFLAKHYGGVVGSDLFSPIATVTATDHHSLVTATLAGGADHREDVRAFLVAYFGNERDGGSLFEPMRTVTARDRFGLVTVEGQDFEVSDIGLRMLAPRELYRAQGFPDSYRIDVEFEGKPLSKSAQVRMCGNSVVPQLAAALVAANVGAVKIAEVA